MRFISKREYAPIVSCCPIFFLLSFPVGAMRGLYLLYHFIVFLFLYPFHFHTCGIFVVFSSSFYLFILSSWTHVCSVFIFLSFYLFSFYLVILSSWTHVSSLSSLSFYLIPFPLSFPFVAHMWHLCLFIILSVYPFQLDPCSVFIFLSFYPFPFYLVILSSWIHVVSGSEGLLVCG